MYKVFVEKKEKYREKTQKLKEELISALNVDIKDFRVINMYYSSEKIEEEIITDLLMDYYVDEYSLELDLKGYKVFRAQYLANQFCQRTYWLNQCLKVMDKDKDIKFSYIYAIKGVNESELVKIKDYLINPIETEEKELFDFTQNFKRTDKDISFDKIEDFFTKDNQEIINDYKLSISSEDLDIIKEYFKSENRLINITELKFLDTYWSDHCRHTTFNTVINSVDKSDYNVKDALKYNEKYLKETKKENSLMNLATHSIRIQKKKNNLKDLFESVEQNACTIEREIEGKTHLIMFKNETHNHPTEIEPFGGAQTCLGGAIRDPMSARARVYQSMRITGASDITDNNKLEGKLYQSQITKKALEGFSSYGNQIGLATGEVKEYYHKGFVAKRMEVGFVIGSVEKENIIVEEPKEGDYLILLGGPTGRDGIGGASGSSKTHKEKTVSVSASEVQKGNATEERKIQRLLNRKEITKKIKRSNDLGAGGISVSFGEIADGLELEISDIKTKYKDIYPYELLLSESQERMAFVIDKKDYEFFLNKAEEENLYLKKIGEVTDKNRFVVKYKGEKLIDFSREFLNTSGAKRFTELELEKIDYKKFPTKYDELYKSSQYTLTQQFDHSINSLNVLSPFCGKKNKTMTEGMVSIIPNTKKREIVTVVTHGYNPYMAEFSPYHGAYFSVLSSISKNVSLGSDIEGIRFSFQEYFQKLITKKDWSKPYLALLGANRVLDHFSLASIGGKDSMSGSYSYDDKTINVAPTLISFAVNTANIKDIIPCDFKDEDSDIVLLKTKLNDEYLYNLSDYEEKLKEFIKAKKDIISSKSVDIDLYNTIEDMKKASNIDAEIDIENDNYYASIVIQLKKDAYKKYSFKKIGEIKKGKYIEKVYDNKVEKVFPAIEKTKYISDELFDEKLKNINNKKEVNVLIPIFTGTNCEEDVRSVFEKAGANVKELVFNTSTKEMIKKSINKLANAIDECDILALVGGFSAQDEPEGSAKFIVSVFKNEKVKNAFNSLVDKKGLVLGICNGFQALVKLGVFQENKILNAKDVKMSLTYNTSATHISDWVRVKVHSNKSYWMNYANVNDICSAPISHGEGRFVIDKNLYDEINKKGQILFRYIDNLNGSFKNIEAITSPNGQILGKMAHSERVREDVAINIEDKGDMKIFTSAVESIKGEF